MSPRLLEIGFVVWEQFMLAGMGVMACLMQEALADVNRAVSSSLDFVALSAVGVSIYASFGLATGQYAFVRLNAREGALASFRNWSGAIVVLGLALWLFEADDRQTLNWLLLWFALSGAALFIGRRAACMILGQLSQSHRLRRRRLAILGATEQAACFLDRLRRDHTSPLYEIVGVFDDPLDGERSAAGSFIGETLRGTTEDLFHLARSGAVNGIVIALPHAAATRIAQTARMLSQVPADLLLCPDLAATTLTFRHIAKANIWNAHVLKLYEQPFQGWQGVGKWLQDKLLAGVGLLIFGSLMLVIALLIRLESPGPALFRQQRFGFNNEPIEVFKFRTMYHDRGNPDGSQRTVRNDPRVTRLGRMLRRSSLDELPQLINVLRGDMSIIGPRAHPVKMKVLDQFYDDALQFYAARHRVRPGITGLAQVNGLRGEVDTLEKAQQRLQYDLQYIENWSLLLDLRILLKTVSSLLLNREAY